MKTLHPKCSLLLLMAVTFLMPFLLDGQNTNPKKTNGLNSYRETTVNGYRVAHGQRPPIDLSQLPPEAFESGRIRVKMTPSAHLRLQGMKFTATQGGHAQTGVAAFDQLNAAFGVSDYRPIFEEFAIKSASHHSQRNRHQAWGFHLWYELEIESGKDVVQAVNAFASLKEVEHAEPVFAKRRIGNVGSFPGQDSPKVGVSWIPNDPQFSLQWHYQNTGQSDGVKGKDINVVEAWEMERGHPDVIVAIVDEGVQFDHPDLEANMWSGLGYDFATNSPNITPGNHGTHVAGTVAAVNNNGVGVSGIAGGSGTGDGVRLMSCQVFSDWGGGGFELAPIYAADNGAAISQNSWGYTSPGVYEELVLDAIDYFNANGGGEVLNGGITIFASGNDDSSGDYYPGYYEGTLSVAATNNRDEKAWYSNYGSWVDISAPGGETNSSHTRGVLSSVNGNSYEFYQGTSMACPHVSGVAALLVSYAHRNGVKIDNAELWDLLVENSDNHYADNPDYIGQLGPGRLNANNSLMAIEEMLNGVRRPASFSATPVSTTQIDLSWVKNDEGNEVMIVGSPEGVFGLPVDGQKYGVGYVFTDGGEVLYKGPGTAFSHTGLNASTEYFYRAYSFSSEDEYSWGRNVSAYTHCDAQPLPYFESFESGTMIPMCWSTVDADGDKKNWGVGGTAFSPQDGDFVAVSASSDYAVGGLTPDNWLFTPKLLMSANNVLLKFYVKAQNPSAANEKFSVMVSNGSAVLADFTEVYTETLESGSWKQVVVPLNGYQNEEVYVAFRHWDCTDQSQLVIDNVSIEEYEIRNLTFTVNPEGAGSVSGEGDYYNGQVVKISATANSGYVFENWVLNGEVVSTDPSLDFTIPTQDVIMEANFTDKIPALSITPESIEEMLYRGNAITRTITLSNTGDEGSSLNVTIDYQDLYGKDRLISQPALVHGLPKGNGSYYKGDLAQNASNKSFTTTPPLTTGASVLYLTTKAGMDAAFNTALQNLENVETYTNLDVISSTPNVDYLLGYDIVVVSSGSWFSDAELLGNNLADYVDAGGRVCLLPGSFFMGGGFTLEGRIMTEAYAPLSTAIYDYGASYSNTLIDHPITANVSQVGTQYWSTSIVQGSGISLGTLETGNPVAAYNAEKPIVAINIDVYDGFWSGDLMQMVQNTIDWLMQNQWFQMDKATVTIPSGGAYAFEVTLNAASLAEGVYESGVLVESNDPEKPLVEIPVSLEVRYERFALTVSANPTDGGLVTGEGHYYENETVLLEATPSEGYMFVNWTINAQSVSTSARYELAMPAHELSLVANFTDKIPELSVDPGFVEASVYSGQSTTKTVTISNIGDEGSILQFSIANQYVSGVSIDGPKINPGSERSDKRKKFSGSFDVAPNKAYIRPNYTRFIFFDDFEDGLGEWQTETFSSADLWHVSDLSYSSPSFALWCGVEGQNSYDNGQRINNAIVSPVISLPNASESIELTFWENYNTEEGFDGGRVEVSLDNGNSWFSVREPKSGNSNGWLHTSIDLSAFAGEEVRIRFYFDTLDEIENDYPGWFIDDVGVGVNSDWLAFEPQEISLPLNASFDLVLTLDATNCEEGVYESVVSLISNDPINPVTHIPVSLTVEYQRFALTLLADPTEGGVVTGNGDYYENEKVTLEASPNEGFMFVNWTLNGEIVSTSASFEFTMPAREIGLVANFTDQVPEIAVEPVAFEVDLFSGQSSTEILTISNIGLGNLLYDIEIMDMDKESGSRDATQFFIEPRPKHEKGDPIPDYYSQSPVTSGGGPDEFGYSWSVVPIDWQDASSGTSVLLSDDSWVGSIPMGFDFEYYGQNYSEINIMSNGWVSFSSLGSWYPSCVPGSDNGGAIVPFGRDLYPPGYGHIYYQTQGVAPNRRFIIEYNDIEIYGSEEIQTFQVVFHERTGVILFQYLEATQAPQSLGIESPSRTTGMGNCASGDLFMNPNMVESNLAIRFSPMDANWLSLSSHSGAVLSEEESQVEVTFDATNLSQGVYEAFLRISSIDPKTPVVNVPISLTVTGASLIELSHSEIAFGEVAIGTSYPLSLSISNSGTANLLINNILSSDSHFSVSASNLEVPVGEVRELIITFHSQEQGAFEGLLTLNTNAPSNPNVSVDLSAQALVPAGIEVNPESVFERLGYDERVERVLTITNSGGMSLNYSASTFLDLTINGNRKFTSTIDLGTRTFESSNNAGGQPQTQNEFISYNKGSNGGTSFNVLIYEDIATNGWYMRALNALGFDYTSVSSWEALTQAMNGVTQWDLVLVNSYVNSCSYLVLDALTEYVSGGGKLIFAHWTGIDFSDHLFAQVMGIDVVSDISVPVSFSLTSNASVLSSPNVLPDGFAWKTDQYHSDGQIVEAVAGADRLGVFDGYPNSAAIVLNASRNALFNAFQADNFSGDDSGSGKPDIQELIENQIAFLLLRNLVVTPSWGVAPGGEQTELTLVLNAEGLTGGTYYGNITIASNDPLNPELIVPVTLEVGISTGMEGPSRSSAQVSPNPFSTSITVNAAYDVSRVVVTNMLGIRLIEVESSRSESITIPTSHLVEGVYLISLYNQNGGVEVLKMFKRQ